MRMLSGLSRISSHTKAARHPTRMAIVRPHRRDVYTAQKSLRAPPGALEARGVAIISVDELRGKIRAISAHGRMTGLALTCIPLAVALIMFYVNPDYVRFFITDETGQIMAGAAIVLQVIGYLIIKKIVTIEV